MCKWKLSYILNMKDFDLKKYLAENKLIKEDNFEEAVEGIELSLIGMSPSDVANAIASALKKILW